MMHQQTRTARGSLRGPFGGWLTVVAATWLLLTSTVTLAIAQAQPIPAGSTVSVANTDGERLNLRDGPSIDRAVVTRLDPGARLTVTGPAQTAGGIVWIPVRAAGGQTGYVSAQYLQGVSTPSPTSTRTPVPQTVPVPAPASGSADPAPTATPVPGKSVTVEAKLKFPETDGREQEITVWVTRDGRPVPGVIVTLQTRGGEDDEIVRELDPTNDEGWTRRSFDVRHEKGTVELLVRAVAPDGGQGETTVSYFRR